MALDLQEKITDAASTVAPATPESSQCADKSSSSTIDILEAYDTPSRSYTRETTCPDNDLLADDLLSDSESSDISPCVEEAFDANCDELIPDCEASCFRAPEFYIASEDDSILDDSASPDLRPRLEEVFDVNWNELTRDILEK